jgi:hypothetical protein
MRALAGLADWRDCRLGLEIDNAELTTEPDSTAPGLVLGSQHRGQGSCCLSC